MTRALLYEMQLTCKSTQANHPATASDGDAYTFCRIGNNVYFFFKQDDYWRIDNVFYWEDGYHSNQFYIYQNGKYVAITLPEGQYTLELLAEEIRELFFIKTPLLLLSAGTAGTFTELGVSEASGKILDILQERGIIGTETNVLVSLIADAVGGKLDAEQLKNMIELIKVLSKKARPEEVPQLVNRIVDDWAAGAKKALQGAGKTGVKIVDDFLATLPKIDNLLPSNLPPGYQIFTTNGSKYIRRIDVNNPNTPRLMVDETGKIVPYIKPQRLANSTKLRANLEKNLGIIAPDNHQAHHIVPSNIVENSALHQEAMKRGLYDVDRAGNGKFLAETDEDFVSLSEAYPTHFGSHPNYDSQIRNQIDDIILTNNIDIFNLQTLTNQQLSTIIDSIENRALKVLENWQPSKLN